MSFSIAPTRAAHGLAVTELTPPNRKAGEEISTLFRYLFEDQNTAKR